MALKRLLLIFIMTINCGLVAMAQSVRTTVRRYKITENSVVKDSAGVLYPFALWQKMMQSGDYELRPIDPANDSTAFLIHKSDRKVKIIHGASDDNAMSLLPKPPESMFFTTGEKIGSFSANDINGNKIKLSELKGKVVVLNFWFIGCPPCRMEIPELNKIALKYSSDPNIIFIAVALDYKYDIKQFIKDNPFAYHIIDDGRIYANLYKITLYPTNVILDKEGRVRFHASGYTTNTPYWIEKTIDELK